MCIVYYMPAAGMISSNISEAACLGCLRQNVGSNLVTQPGADRPWSTRSNKLPGGGADLHRNLKTHVATCWEMIHIWMVYIWIIYG